MRGAISWFLLRPKLGLEMGLPGGGFGVPRGGL